jgi:hypothetical protein
MPIPISKTENESHFRQPVAPKPDFPMERSVSSFYQSGETLTTAKRAVCNANKELKGVLTVDWSQLAPKRRSSPTL